LLGRIERTLDFRAELDVDQPVRMSPEIRPLSKAKHPDGPKRAGRLSLSLFLTFHSHQEEEEEECFIRRYKVQRGVHESI
jgi:hypothetical protein